MKKNNILKRLICAAALSSFFSIGIRNAAFYNCDYHKLLIINAVCSIIILICIFPIIKLLFTDSKFKGTKWNILKIFSLLWVIYLIIGNIYLLLKN